MLKNPLTLLDLASSLERLTRVALWIINNPRSGIYIRQLNLTDVDTKFIEGRKSFLSEWLDILLDPDYIDQNHSGVKGFEKRYGFLEKPATVRFRILDESKYIEELSDLTVRADEFSKLNLDIDTVFVTENDTNGLAFPMMKSAIVLFGRGYGFDFLKDAHWLKEKCIRYWGDIDTHGFAILNQFRNIFPGTESILMDRDTLLSHKNYWVKETSPIDALLENLTEEELSLYDDLRCNRLGNSVRLEQEFVSFEYLTNELLRN